jgi:glucokinase
VTKTGENSCILAGDIGATKTNLGLFSEGRKRPVLKEIETFSSRKAPDLAHMIQKFLQIHNVPVTRACFGVAGPVLDGTSKITNLSWTISQDQIKNAFNFEHVGLINDLAATAMAIPLLKPNECFPLNQARSLTGHNIALIGVGTGLGTAILLYQDGRYQPIFSEGGHADFAPNNHAEMALWHYLHQLYGHVSIERAISGSGIVNIYNWFKNSGRLTEPAWLSQKLKETDPAKSITDAALMAKDPGCMNVLNMFVSILGAVSGNLALTGMTTGGVYLAGGIPPKILSQLKGNMFMDAFTNKGRFRTVLEKIAVKVVLNDKAALIGAAHCALSGICNLKRRSL